MKVISIGALFFSVLLLWACKKTTVPINTNTNNTYTNPGELTITSFIPDSAEIGDTVTILGKEFSPTLSQNQVSVSGKLQTAFKASANEIRIVIQPGTTSGTINVKVVNMSATSVTALNILP
jgi:hypothetical protein